MKMIVVTTITTTLDIDTMHVSHSVDVEDQDGLSEVSREVLGAVLIGAMHATENTVREQFPQARAAAERLDAAEATPITDEEY